MLNLDETLTNTSAYIVQRDLYLKSFVYSFTVIIFVDILRSQVSEVNLLQLVPGFYLILLFLSFIYLVFFSNLLNYLTFTNDNNRSLGTKTTNKMETTVLLKFSFFLLFTGLIVVFNSVIPLSLDSFNNYGEKTLENLWSFDEVLTLEITLFIILIVLSQLPVVIITAFTTEKDVNIFPEFWKSLSVFIFLIAGLLTPTIDGYTQLSFAGSAVSLYLIIINVTEKKVNIKFPGTAFLGS
jgi:hypothetical protein